MARERILSCVAKGQHEHAENGDMLDHCTRTLLAVGRRNPRYYAESRPALAEAEANTP